MPLILDSSLCQELAQERSYSFPQYQVGTVPLILDSYLCQEPAQERSYSFPQYQVQCL